MTLAYSIKVQIKGNLKNSSHLSVSFYNVNERNKNFFLKYPSCEISVYYYDNFLPFHQFSIVIAFFHVSYFRVK